MENGKTRSSVKDNGQVNQNSQEGKIDVIQGIRRVLWFTMFLNFVPTFWKLTVGYLTNSLSLIADGFDSVFDAASNVIGLVGIWVAAKPASVKYPYGQRKAETITALVICYMLFLTTWEFVKDAISRLMNPTQVSLQVNFWSFFALGVSIAFHFYVVHYELKAGRKLQSQVLVADAMHTRADILISVAVGLGLVFVLIGIPIADPILALVVAVVIANIGIGIIRETIPTLMDKKIMPVDKVEQIVLSVPGIRSVHQVRSRGHEQAVFADLHIRVDPGMSTERAHAIAHEVGRRLRQFEKDLQDVTIHVEPADKPASPVMTQETIATPYRRIAFGLGASIHDLWVHEVNPGEYFLESHVEIDGSMPLKQAHELITNIENRAREEIPGIKGITSHLEPFGKLTSSNTTGQDEESVIEEIKNTVNLIHPDAECHNIKIYNDGSRLLISLHVNLPGDLSLVDAHGITLDMETRLREKLPNLERVTIHPEPMGTVHESQE